MSARTSPTAPAAPRGIAPAHRRISRKAVFVRRIVIANVFLFTLTACGIAYGYWFRDRSVAGIARTDVTLQKVIGDKPVNFLLIGSDTRSFVNSAKDAQSFGNAQSEGGQRSDTMMVARVDPKTKRTLLVSFPRDLWVDIPGVGPAKINAAFNRGPQAVVDTLKANFGIQINHYVEVNFAGFRSIVDAIGTVRLFFPTVAQDTRTGLFVGRPGCVALNGQQALAYVRSRYYQYKNDWRDATWKDDPTGDLGRIRRQQYFMRSLAGNALSALSTRPWRVNSVVTQVVRSLRADKGLKPGDLTDLLMAFRSTDPGAIEMQTVPADPGWNADRTQSILELDAAKAAPIFARLRGALGEPGAPAPVPKRAPSTVSVRVLNGSGITGVARKLSDQLTSLGFRAGGYGNAPSSGVALTEVRTAANDAGAGALVAAYLGGTPTVVNDDTLGAGSVVVIVGTDQPTPRVPGATTASTATNSPDSTTSTSSTIPPNPGRTPGVTVPPTELGRPLVGCG